MTVNQKTYIIYDTIARESYSHIAERVNSLWEFKKYISLSKYVEILETSKPFIEDYIIKNLHEDYVDEYGYRSEDYNLRVSSIEVSKKLMIYNGTYVTNIILDIHLINFLYKNKIEHIGKFKIQTKQFDPCVVEVTKL